MSLFVANAKPPEVTENKGKTPLDKASRPCYGRECPLTPKANGMRHLGAPGQEETRKIQDKSKKNLKVFLIPYPNAA